LTQPSKRNFSDVEIFFAALLGLSATLVGRRLLTWITAELGADAFAPSLATRFGTSTTIANFSTFFVQLPVALAFVAIGIPFALRSCAALLRRQTSRREAFGILAFVAATIGLFYEARAGRNGLLSVTAIAMISLWQTWHAMAARALRFGYWCIAAGASCLLGLAYYEWLFVGGAEASLFVGPTFLVVAFYMLGAGLIMTLPGALARPHRSPAANLVTWLAVAMWLASPQLRAQAPGVDEANLLELGLVTASAAALLLTAVVRQARD
jgi:hypothetical protein